METQFMKNTWCSGDQVEMNDFLIAETTSCVYLVRSPNMENSMEEELDRGRSFCDTRSSRHAQIRPWSRVTVAQQREEWNMSWGPHN
ncbi:hypothetical protein KIN20_012623 [Parelaphostrongylus tenuis]|uniref:Uncharacterized protein n=1 Tax=Parelaphostrongylus tenuis TaxID=148309 RepID=A0AAD5QQK1_PARTN|nr:hypothetical protein KIN20_012623 [Parelaphostrongylus tenuis]